MTVNAQGQGNQVVNARPVNGGVAEPTMAELKARIAELEASRNASISFKCYAKGETYTDGQGKMQTGKGCMSMSGLGRFPVSLYKSQWDRLIAAVKNGSVEAALVSFKDKLASKE